MDARIESGNEKFNYIESQDTELPSSSTTTSPSPPRFITMRRSRWWWWTKRTELEKCLFLTFFVFFVLSGAFIVLVVLLVFKYENILSNRGDTPNPSVTGPTCLTSDCVTAAAAILKNIDQSVSPCEDFYKFSCGGFTDNHYIDEGENIVSEWGLVENKLERHIKEIAEEESQESNPSYVTMMKMVYNQCINMSAINEYQATPVFHVIDELGGWPLHYDSNDIEYNISQFDWIDKTITLKKLGFDWNVFVSVSVSVDLKNNTQYMIEIDQPTLNLEAEYLRRGMDDDVVRYYYHNMANIFQEFGTNITSNATSQQFKDLMNFEMGLAKISLAPEERRNYTQMYNKMPLKDVSKFAPNIDWLKLVSNLVNDPIDQFEEVNVISTDFIKNLDALMLKTDKITLANYMALEVIQGSLNKLGQRFDKFTIRQPKAPKKTSVKPRWKTCMTWINDYFGLPLSALYVQKHYDDTTSDRVRQMISYIQEVFIGMLSTVDWMDADTRSFAMEKAKAMIVSVAYPREILNESNIAEFYKGLNLSESNTFFHNTMALNNHILNFNLNQLRKRFTRNDWRNSAEVTIVNAFYSPTSNGIQFPAGILQGIFFDRQRPAYLNFGSMGFLIGHEITHGFDDEGRQIDKDGTKRNWWKAETDKKFHEKTRCIIDQYSAVEVPGTNMKINGNNTQGENIADNGGIKQAFLAYQNFVRDFGKEPLLPGVPYSQNQLFFISAAQIWCRKITIAALMQLLVTDNHSPNKWRIIIPMANFDKFSETFSCPKGSPMNPEKQCSVW